MLATASDARLLAASIQTILPVLCKPRLQGKAAQSEVMATLAVCLLGHWLYIWTYTCDGYYRLLALWTCVELCFYAYSRWRYHIINELVDTQYNMARVAEVKRRFLSLSGCISIEKFLSGWFHGAPYEAIRRGNVEDFVAYGFYCRTVQNLPPQLQRATADFVRKMEQKWGASFPEGRNPDISFMAHCWEDLRVLPKPLALHLGSELISFFGRCLLRVMGFRMQTCQGFTYWIRRPDLAQAQQDTSDSSRPATPSQSRGATPSVSPGGTPTAAGRAAVESPFEATFLGRGSGLDRTKSIIHRRGDSFSSLRSDEGGETSESMEPRPIFFLHGVGLGLIPYLGLLQQTIWACPRTPMILLEVPHVSLRLQLRAKAVDDVAHAAAQILWRHAFGDACFVAHSYGTFCVSRICQLHRSLVHSMALIDPVCFLTCYPHLLYNFIYKLPRLADFTSLVGLLSAARFLFSRDLIIAETFCRKFMWHELMLWPEDMPAHALVVLSHEDDLVPAPLVAKHIEQSHSRALVMYHPTAGHGGFLADFPFQQQMVQGIKQLAELPDESASEAFVGTPTGAKLDRRFSMKLSSLSRIARQADTAECKSTAN